MGDNDNDASWKDALSFFQGAVPLIVAVIVLIVFGLLVMQMLNLRSAAAEEWNRAVYVFGVVEAIAFAAVGFLFGREVNRQRAEQAEARADIAQKDATEAGVKATEETTKGKTLKQLINAKRSSSPIRMQLFQQQDISPAALASHSDIDELARVAEELFP